MARSHMFKRRLNMSSKHRWSMLRNMSASLILHEKIITTSSRAKSLLPVINKIFKFAFKNDSRSKDKINGLLRIPYAYHKLIKNLIYKFKNHLGSVATIKQHIKRRKNDNAKMATVEFIKTKNTNYEDMKFKYLQNSYGLNFTYWELHTRKKELEKYRMEKNKRDNIYSLLRTKLVNFGKTDVDRLKSDLSIPLNSELTMYLKALNPKELDTYHEKIDKFLSYKILDTEAQIKILEQILDNKRLAKNYEKRNFNINILDTSANYVKEFKKEYTDIQIEKNEMRNLLSLLKDEHDNINESNEFRAQILKEIYDYIKEKKYDIKNLTEEDKKDIHIQKSIIINQLHVRKEFGLDIFFRNKIKKHDKYFSKNYHVDYSSDFTDSENLPQIMKIGYDKNLIIEELEKSHEKPIDKLLKEANEEKIKKQKDEIERIRKEKLRFLESPKIAKSLKKKTKTKLLNKYSH